MKTNKTNLKERAENSLVLAYLKQNVNKVFTRDELAARFNTSDREMRREIALIAEFYPILSLSRLKGYCLVEWNGDADVNYLNIVRNYLIDQVKEDNNRIKAIKKRMRPLIANIKVLDKIINDKTQANGKE